MDYYVDNLPKTAMGVLDLFSTSQTGIDVFSDQIIDSVKAGETNPLRVRVWIKTLETIISRLKSETNHEQLVEADKWSEKTFEYAGAMITKSEHGTKYDFSNCGDPEWEKRDHSFMCAKNRLKEREDFLKALKEPLNTFDEETGETFTIKPPIKTSTSGLNVTIK